MALVNRYNFLRWSNSATETTLDLPNGYRRDTGGCPYMPLAYVGEQLSFYINSTGFTNADFGISAFSELVLQLIDARNNSVVSGAPGTLIQHVLPDGKFNIYCTLTFSSKPAGQYYFKIVRSGIEQLRSNLIEYCTDKAKLDRETVLVRFRHDRFFYNIRYQDIPGFYQQFRLTLNMIEQQPETDRDTYREVTTGKVRTSETYLSRVCTVESYYFDRLAHEAALVMTEHSFLEMNGKSYTLKNTYKENTNQLSNYSKGQFDVYDDEFASVNRC